MPSPRSGIAAAFLATRIYVIGGESPRGAFTQAESYDPSLNTWSENPSLPEARHGTGAVSINGVLYVPAGGAINGGARPTNTLLVFHP
jgi:hypothetical protein